MVLENEKPRDHARLLSPDEIDGLDADSHELADMSDSFDSTDARLRGYEGAEAYSKGRRGGGIYNSIMSRLSPKTTKHLLIGVGVALLLIIGASMMPSTTKTETIYKWVSADLKDSKTNVNMKKPEGLNITGVIFYGRAQFVDILDCYLRQNLAVNGGLLDSVLFLENTDNENDLAYLRTLVEEVPQYERREVKRQGGHGWGGFDTMWSHLTEENTIYLKVDDDIVWVHEDAVPRMIQSLLRHPEAHDIAGNIINSPLTNWLHYHNEAVHAFLPENAPHPSGGNQTEWRVNELPAHDGSIPEEYDFSFREDRPPSGFAVGQKGGPPYENHRWLLLTNDTNNSPSAQLMKTPIAKASYDAFGMGWQSWAMAAQQHYSLFKNIEDEQLHRYWFGNAEGIWNMQYERYNLNFLAIRGESVRMKLPGRDDEEDLTVKIPKQFHRPCLVDSHALIAHFNFGTQPEMIHTDLLDRFRAYANEKVCTKDNQKKRLPKPQKSEER